MSRGVPDTTTNNSSTDETSRADGNSGQGHGGEEGGDGDGHLLRAVGEVVVSRAHEVKGTSGRRLDSTTVEQTRSGVEVLAVLRILLVVSSQLRIGFAASSLSGRRANGGLIQLTKTIGHSLRDNLDVGDQVVVVVARHGSLLQRHQVGAIGLIETLTSVTSLVEVRTSPLEMDVIGLSDLEVVGGEIVLSGRVALHNVSTATTDSQVVDASTKRNVGRSGGDQEGVRAILESSTILVGVDSEGQVAEL